MKKLIQPLWYKLSGGKDLLDILELLLSPEEMRGFYKGNVIKYVIRYQLKNKKEDLEKAITYLERLIKWQYPDNPDSKDKDEAA